MLDKDRILGIVKSLGLVFGDIGTSPIYTLTVIFFLTIPTKEHVIGILSLIIWTLIIVVTIEYAWLAMSLGQKGEGGTIVLKEIITPLLDKKIRNKKIPTLIVLISFIGISLLFGDGVITPAISILSAVEGVTLVPGFEGITSTEIVFIAVTVAILLFSIQKKGAEKIAWTFGPIMSLWFLSIAISGLISILHGYFDNGDIFVLRAINPYYAIKYLLDNGITGFFMLSQVILCATGGEALYADMGHLGKDHIIRAWYIVFIALLLNYMGQGAFIISHPGTKNILFEMIFQYFKILYIPFLVLCILATIIASQAMISGVFSIVYQGITTRVLPMLKIDYTSSELMSQIYIGVANWLLLLSVIFVMLIFKESKYLAEAYGLAVTGTMAITGILMTIIFYLKDKKLEFILSLFVTFVDMIFLLSCIHKIPYGGYWSIILASIPFVIIMIYTSGQRKLFKALKPMNRDNFIEKYKIIYKENKENRIKGTAIFFARDVEKIPPYISNIMFGNGIIYDDNIFISIMRLDEPYGVTSRFKNGSIHGLRIFEIRLGYMEIVDIEKILKNSGINEKVMFYGIEDIVTDNIAWKTYSLIKKLTPTFVQFYKLPSHKIHGVITRIEM